jgi:hypothetical protein
MSKYPNCINTTNSGVRDRVGSPAATPRSGMAPLILAIILLVLSVQKNSQQISVFCTFGGPITHGAPARYTGALYTPLTTSVYQFPVNVIITHLFLRTFSPSRQTNQHQSCQPSLGLKIHLTDRISNRDDMSANIRTKNGRPWGYYV